ncbi:MAG: hypothetical protein GY861_07770 [bacterium]|nr:hypothetical protein [bacterium]
MDNIKSAYLAKHLNSAAKQLDKNALFFSEQVDSLEKRLDVIEKRRRKEKILFLKGRVKQVEEYIDGVKITAKNMAEIQKLQKDVGKIKEIVKLLSQKK